MTTINDLPTELFCQIFNDVFISSTPPPSKFLLRRRFFQEQAIDSHKSTRECAFLDAVWNYEKFGHVTMSAFTLARVCTRWYDIVAHFPQFWTHIVCDLSRPLTQRQLEAFALCAPHPFVLYVFSDKNLCKEKEQTRASAITKVLHGHIDRCTSITFKLHHASALPQLEALLSSPRPHLEEIRMECRVQDYNPHPISQLHDCVRHLHHISLNGRVFMSLSHCHPDYLAKIGSDRPLTLRVTDLSLQRYEFHLFMGLLDAISPDEIFLTNLTLDARPLKRRNLERTYEHITELFQFVDVCPSFISDFFNSSTFDYVYLFKLVGCRVPRMRARLPDDGIELHDIPQDPPPALPDQSLRNILSIFDGTTLEMVGCTSLTDDTLGWLATREVAQYIHRITVRDCPNITPLGVRHLLTMRHGHGSRSKLVQFFAEGDVQPLDEDDVLWFRRWKKEGYSNIIVWPGHKF